MKLSIPQVAEYLTRRFNSKIEVVSLTTLGDNQVKATGRDGIGALKTFGYGEPILVTYVQEGAEKRVVFHTVAANHFGHEDRADRAAEVVRSYDIYNSLPQHAPAIDMGIVAKGNSLRSLADGREFFFITQFVEGKPYAQDLERLRSKGEVSGLDLRRAYDLAKYLAQIHALKRNDPPLYLRRIRDTVGSGEGIMGLIDSYPKDYPSTAQSRLEAIEQLCVTWRWKLKARPHRLAQVHGDFHPFNVLFAKDTEFNLLDRSRGAWGEPADDVICMAINYLFFSLQRSGSLAPPFEQLWNIFWNTYLKESQDNELTKVIAPFFAWRALVLANPVWYNVTATVRESLLTAAENVLRSESFDPAQINSIITVPSHESVDEPKMKEVVNESA